MIKIYLKFPNSNSARAPDSSKDLEVCCRIPSVRRGQAQVYKQELSRAENYETTTFGAGGSIKLAVNIVFKGQLTAPGNTL